MKTMIIALIGMNSPFSRDNFHCALPHDSVSFIKTTHKLMKTRKNEDISDENSTKNSVESIEVGEFLNKNCFECKIDALNKLINEEDVSALESDLSSGTKLKKVRDGEKVFLIQLESYLHRGNNLLIRLFK